MFCTFDFYNQPVCLMKNEIIIIIIIIFFWGYALEVIMLIVHKLWMCSPFSGMHWWTSFKFIQQNIFLVGLGYSFIFIFW